MSVDGAEFRPEAMDRLPATEALVRTAAREGVRTTRRATKLRAPLSRLSCDPPRFVRAIALENERLFWPETTYRRPASGGAARARRVVLGPGMAEAACAAAAKTSRAASTQGGVSVRSCES